MLDEYLGFDEWKRADEDPFYDWRLVKKARPIIFAEVLSVHNARVGQTFFEDFTPERRHTWSPWCAGDLYARKFCRN